MPREVSSPAARQARQMSYQQRSLDDIEKDYDFWWNELQKTWMPLSNYSYTCVGLGLKNLLEAYGYLCMATLYSEYGSAWSFWAVQVIFTSLNVLIAQMMLHNSDAPEKDRSDAPGIKQTLQVLFSAGGPISCAIAATTSYVWLDRILVPICFCCHC